MRAQRFEKGGKPLAGAGIAVEVVADIPDPAIAPLEQESRAFASGCAVGETDRQIKRIAVQIEQLDDPAAACAQHLHRALRVLVPRQHHSRGPPGEHCGGKRFFLPRVIVGDGEDRLIPVFLQNGAGAAQNIGKDDVG